MAWKRPEPATTKLPGQHRVAGGLVDRVGLAGEQRLVDLETGRGTHDPVDGDLVARLELEQIVEHDALDRDLGLSSVANHAGMWCVRDGELVERALGADLLDDPDQRVRDEDHAERRVLDLADHQDDGQHHAEDRVEPREDVGPDDLAVGSARALARVVHEPARPDR